ncbi:MAG: NADH-quinone oxidoreductase subunit J [Bacteroidia bacterium]
MNATTIIFYILASVILGGALLAVTARKIFRSAIYLLFSLIGVAGLYFYMEYEFIAAVQVVVYVGGIVVLIIFSIFLTQESGRDMKEASLLSMLFTGFGVCFGAVLTLLLIDQWNFMPSVEAPLVPTVQEIGRQMLSTTNYGYVLPFEVVSMLLLGAMIGCIVIAMKVKASDKEID